MAGRTTGDGRADSTDSIGQTHTHKLYSMCDTVYYDDGIEKGIASSLLRDEFCGISGHSLCLEQQQNHLLLSSASPFVISFSSVAHLAPSPSATRTAAILPSHGWVSFDGFPSTRASPILRRDTLYQSVRVSFYSPPTLYII